MSDRAAAQFYAKEFETLAQAPTPKNMQMAQGIYQSLFIVGGIFIPYGKYDFHPGEMYCTDALKALDVHRHPDDSYLARRGIDAVMDMT